MSGSGATCFGLFADAAHAAATAASRVAAAWLVDQCGRRFTMGDPRGFTEVVGARPY